MIQIKCAFTKMVAISEILFHPKNANTHSDAQIEKLAKLIKKNGIRHPIIISSLSNYVIAGHGRVEALKKLGVEKIPCDVQDFQTKKEEYAFMVSDNAIASWAELNLDLIELDLKEFDDLDPDDLAIKDFDFNGPPQMVEPLNETDVEEKYLLQVQLSNELDLADLFDDLTSKGYLVKKI